LDLPTTPPESAKVFSGGLFFGHATQSETVAEAGRKSELDSGMNGSCRPKALPPPVVTGLRVGKVLAKLSLYFNETLAV
jgi:hypothetical protein